MRPASISLHAPFPWSRRLSKYTGLPIVFLNSASTPKTATFRTFAFAASGEGKVYAFPNTGTISNGAALAGFNVLFKNVYATPYHKNKESFLLSHCRLSCPASNGTHADTEGAALAVAEEELSLEYSAKSI
jgi:hypothetical protein